MHASVAPAQLVKDAKRKSSRLVRERFGKDAFAWQNGYGAFTISRRAVDTVTAYVENQKFIHAHRKHLLEHLEVRTYEEGEHWNATLQQRRTRTRTRHKR